MPCSLCNGPTVSTVVREAVPTLQNRVFACETDARAAKWGRLDIHACPSCGYALNTAFDPALVEYDSCYNNDVPSRIFDEYYQEIASYLHLKYLPHGGTVLDIGCGKGKFLQVMTELFRDVEGVGIDPSCRSSNSERLTLVSGVFPHCHSGVVPDLVVCRHTLEHIPDPVSFIRAIAGALPAGTPVFFEVPDARWIVHQRAFWDWCYEHVNYFVTESATAALSLAGVRDISCSAAFGGQYMWVEGLVGPVEKTEFRFESRFADEMINYASHEQEYTVTVRNQVLASKKSGNAIAVWGMATKGIEFVGLIDPDAVNVDYCVDINTAKQGKYTPLSARVIRSPDVLQQVRTPLVVIVMNPRYLDEIRAECMRMSIHAEYITFLH